VRCTVIQCLDPEKRVDLPDAKYAYLKAIADRIGLIYEEFTRITIDQVINTYFGHANGN
jgi:hypothetical protein